MDGRQTFRDGTSNCILPDYVVAALLVDRSRKAVATALEMRFCAHAYSEHLDPATLYPYAPNPQGFG